MRFWTVHVAAPLLLGGSLYAFVRPRGLLFWTWADALGMSGALDALRTLASPCAAALPAWVSFTLPDALWVYAFTAAVARRERDASVSRAIFLAVPLLLGPGAELLQLVSVLPGTFDVLDLIATLLAYALALVMARSVETRQQHLQEFNIM